jgi:hypothetical protein
MYLEHKQKERIEHSVIECKHLVKVVVGATAKQQLTKSLFQ